jgi:tRNA nucleotidyltransferase (CCA-adding enzyme)
LRKDIFDEISRHLEEDDAPSAYIGRMAAEPFFGEYPFSMLLRMKETEQPPAHHPEGSVWNHTMLVLDNAAKLKSESKDPKVFMWAALLHDIGKPDTTRIRNGKITSYDHDKLGYGLAKKFLSELTDDGEFIEKVAVLVRWHMQILFVVKNFPFADIRAMKRQADVKEIALLGMCDRMGRLNPDTEKEERNIRAFLEKVQ